MDNIKKSVFAKDVDNEIAKEKTHIEETRIISKLEYIDSIYERLLNKYINALNNYIEESWDIRQWRIIFEEYEYVLLDLYEFYCYIKHHNNQYEYLIPNEYINIDYETNTDFPNNKNLQIAFLCNKFGIPTRGYEENSNSVTEDLVKSQDRNFVKEIIYRVLTNPNWIRLFYYRFRYGNYSHNIYELKPNCDVLITGSRLPVEDNDYIYRKAKGRVSHFNPEYIAASKEKYICSIDKELRDVVFGVNINDMDEFEIFASEYLKLVIKPDYLESVRPLLEYVKNLPYKSLKKIYHSAGMANATFRVFAAYHQSLGTQICDIQHAGAFGVWRLFAFFEHKNYDKFLTWGWTDLLYDKAKPVTIYRYPQDRFATKKRLKKITMITSDAVVGGEFAGVYNAEYLERRLEFIDTLDEGLRRKLTIRTRTHDMMDCLKSILDEKYPYIRYECMRDKALVESIAESELVVLDYSASTMIEALIYNVPYVVFEGVNCSSEGVDWKTIKKKMMNVDIYREDGVELAKILNEKEDFRKWLSSKEVVSVYRELGECLARLNCNIKKVWLDEYLSD